MLVVSETIPQTGAILLKADSGDGVPSVLLLNKNLAVWLVHPRLLQVVNVELTTIELSKREVIAKGKIILAGSKMIFIVLPPVSLWITDHVGLKVGAILS